MVQTTEHNWAAQVVQKGLLERGISAETYEETTSSSSEEKAFQGKKTWAAKAQGMDEFGDSEELEGCEGG